MVQIRKNNKFKEALKTQEKIGKLINKLDTQIIYLESALDHIDCAISEDKDGKPIQRPVSNPMGMSAELTDGIDIVKQICEKYRVKNDK